MNNVELRWWIGIITLTLSGSPFECRILRSLLPLLPFVRPDSNTCTDIHRTCSLEHSVDLLLLLTRRSPVIFIGKKRKKRRKTVVAIRNGYLSYPSTEYQFHYSSIFVPVYSWLISCVYDASTGCTCCYVIGFWLLFFHSFLCMYTCPLILSHMQVPLKWSVCSLRPYPVNTTRAQRNDALQCAFLLPVNSTAIYSNHGLNRAYMSTQAALSAGKP